MRRGEKRAADIQLAGVSCTRLRQCSRSEIQRRGEATSRRRQTGGVGLLCCGQETPVEVEEEKEMKSKEQSRRSLAEMRAWSSCERLKGKQTALPGMEAGAYRGWR